MCRILVFLCCFSAALGAGEALLVQAQLVDRAIRYVNEDIITLGDLVERLQSQRKHVAPTTAEEELAMWRDQLEELTIDHLLAQFADSKGVQIDPDQINLQVAEEARRSGRGLNLVDMARARKRIEKREKVGAALAFFDLRSASVSPGELLDAYERGKEGFRRPARAHVLQIVLRPTDPAERTAFCDDQARVFRLAQDAHPAAAALVSPMLNRLVALDPESPERAALMDEAMAALAALPVTADAPVGLRDVVAMAVKMVQRRAELRTPAESEAQLAELRRQLDGQGAAAFKQACKAISQGPRADEGGDLGWIEPGFFASELDAVIFSLASGELSQPVWSQQACCLILVEERREATQRSFAEVVGELESLLRQVRQQAIRQRAAAALRQRAVIRDLAPLAELIGGG